MLDRIAEIGDDYSWAIEENKHFINHPANQKLAKMTVYTQGKTPDELCGEIVELTDR